MASHFGGSSPTALAARFARLVERLGGDMAAAKAQGQQRDLLAAVGSLEPATLNQISARVKRGAPAVSRAIETLVRAGLVDRQPDPNNRRRLALRLTELGREHSPSFLGGAGQHDLSPYRAELSGKCNRELAPGSFGARRIATAVATRTGRVEARPAQSRGDLSEEKLAIHDALSALPLSDAAEKLHRGQGAVGRRRPTHRPVGLFG